MTAKILPFKRPTPKKPHHHSADLCRYFGMVDYKRNGPIPPLKRPPPEVPIDT